MGQFGNSFTAKGAVFPAQSTRQDHGTVFLSPRSWDSSGQLWNRPGKAQLRGPVYLSPRSWDRSISQLSPPPLSRGGDRGQFGQGTGTTPSWPIRSHTQLPSNLAITVLALDRSATCKSGWDQHPPRERSSPLARPVRLTGPQPPQPSFHLTWSINQFLGRSKINSALPARPNRRRLLCATPLLSS
jgi:hypothetical protein